MRSRLDVVRYTAAPQGEEQDQEDQHGGHAEAAARIRGSRVNHEGLTPTRVNVLVKFRYAMVMVITTWLRLFGSAAAEKPVT